MHSAEAAAGRSSKSSSKTINELTELEMLVGAPSRERVEMKQVINYYYGCGGFCDCGGSGGFCWCCGGGR